MLDVFERTGKLLSPWLIALFDWQYGAINSQFFCILSGRDPLEQRWTELAVLLTRVRLEPFTLEETTLYLSNQSITDENLVNQIHQDTGGLPMLMELLAGTNPQPGQSLPDISREIRRAAFV